ncbi:YifB family Mg chelatase-like AAA ATPase [Fibrella forsythiae]|uniref:YifB family Mg chelatase-like AAA ATPase n=1 Tax=Fibrella forsythiae TaxID=2817061 RepID=A0ABS3JUQ6_9BACT|nr:YifB family Mg chelatase-like AAA ATPase [Fibrella forsythiae]MBO0952637.1 YifB family Mg chelatase-like AAA ATPase [Fibrella forsythiae]
MLAKTFGAAVYGVNARLLTVEVSVSQGVGTSVLGLSENAAKESLQRIDEALQNGGYQQSHQKTVINLSPADIRKECSSYDLPIALCLMATSGKLSYQKNLDDYVILGELALDGKLRPIKGVLPIAIEARRQGFKGFILPTENALEASIVNMLDVIGVDTLTEAIEFLQNERVIEPLITDTRDRFLHSIGEPEADFSHVQGHETIKRSLEIAAAGGHNVILIGPPAAGKTMLVKRLSSILPPLTLMEALETTKIHSIAGKLGVNSTLLARRPYRNPHHSISDVAFVGGGSIPLPGEVSLAHNGVLFLDELPEFNPTVLGGLGQPLDDHKVVISSTPQAVELPASFMLIASMNSCPCGAYSHLEKRCSCTSESIQKYLNMVPGPLYDRIDIHVEVDPINSESTASNRKIESSEQIRERVIQAREKQSKRFEGSNIIHKNAMMTAEMVQEVCIINDASKALLKRAIDRLGLSPKAYNPILKVARTIADLADSTNIGFDHLAEAIQYRSLDKDKWGTK